MTVGLAGLTVIDCSVAAPTNNVVLPEIDPRVALIAMEPTLDAVARPPLPMLATGVGGGSPIPAGGAYHVTCAVMSLELPSE